MWFATDNNKAGSTQNTPRADRRLPKIERPGGVSGWNSDISKTSRGSKGGNKTETGGGKTVVTKEPLKGGSPDNAQKSKGPPPGEKPFFVEDDRKSKITVVSLKSGRTNRTVQTAQSSLTPRRPKPKPKGAKAVMLKAKTKIKDGFRESSIKRIMATGLVIAAALLFLFGVFLPFWSVYTNTVSGVTTGYYGGLWNYCMRISGQGTDCTMFQEASLEKWFRAARGMEMLAFLCVVGATALTMAYMFCFRQVKYGYLQWIIVGLCFGAALFSFIGLVVYGACEQDSSRLSSAYGLTFCAFLVILIAALLFLWDKIKQMKGAQFNKDRGFRGLSGIPSSRPGHRRSRMSHVRSNRSQVSAVSAPRSLGVPNYGQQSARHGTPSRVGDLPEAKET